MDHIVQFAIGIDDNAIVKNVLEHAEKEIIKDLKQQVANKIFRPYWYNGDADPKKDSLSGFSENIIKEMFKENEQYILDKAAAILADKLVRSKKGKEILGNLEA